MATHQICAFTSTHNEGIILSKFYIGEGAKEFILNHKEDANTMLHTFYDIEFGKGEYDALKELELVSLPTLKVTIQDIETSETQVVGIDWILNEINRDRSGKWTNYDETDWKDGWYEWCEGDTYKIINLEN